VILSIQGFTTFATIIIWINLFGALMAAATAIWVQKKLPSVMHVILVPIAIIALIYCVAYAVLLADLVQFENWSAVMRGVSISAWFIVWIYPWWKIASMHQKLLDRHATAAAESAALMENLSAMLEEKIKTLGDI
jgi:Zn-dependent protease